MVWVCLVEFGAVVGLHTLQADTYITAFRRWLSSFGGGGPFGDVTHPNYLEQIGARQSREQLLDRCVGTCGVVQAREAAVETGMLEQDDIVTQAVE